jgi:hypothetical protein
MDGIKFISYYSHVPKPFLIHFFRKKALVASLRGLFYFLKKTNCTSRSFTLRSKKSPNFKRYTMFVFRINKIKIFSNRERRRFLLFGKDRAEVRIMSFVTTEFTDLPNMDDLIASTDPDEQKEILRQSVSTVISRRILSTVENVKDGQTMTFGDTGFSVFFSEKIPTNFDWLLVLIESDQDVRNDAQWVSDILKSEKFGAFSNNLMSNIKLAAKSAGKVAALSNPAYLASIAISKFAVDTLLDSLKKDKDDQLGLLYMSLNRPQHYPFGKRDVQDVDDLTGNMKVDYSLFGVNEVPPMQTEKPKRTRKKKTDTTK